MPAFPQLGVRSKDRGASPSDEGQDEDEEMDTVEDADLGYPGKKLAAPKLMDRQSSASPSPSSVVGDEEDIELVIPPRSPSPPPSRPVSPTKRGGRKGILPSQEYLLNEQKGECLKALRKPPLLSSLHDAETEREADDTSRKAIENLLKGTIERGEGNSCLVLGPRGSGKTRVRITAL